MSKSSSFRTLLLPVALVLMCLAIVVWGKMRKNRAAEELERLQRQIRFSQVGPVAPSAAALESLSGANDQLKSLHAGLDEKLFRGDRRTPFSGDSTAAFFELASFVETTRRDFTNAGISLEEGERFGFSQFEQQGPSPQILESVMSQKQVATVVLQVLLEARPSTFNYLKRELIEEATEDPTLLQQAAGTRSSRRTQLSDTIESGEKLAGFESYSFEVQFEGYSDALRQFLKRLVQAKLAALVTELRVEPLDRYEAVESGSPLASSNPFDVLAAETEEESNEGPVPIIRNNLSSFTVTLELFLGEEARSES